MQDDTIIQEVREHRFELSKKFKFDIKKIVADAQSRQSKSKHRLVSFVHRNKSVM